MADVKEAFAATIASHRVTTAAWQHLASKPLTTKLEAQFIEQVFGTPGPDEADRAKSLRKSREERIASILASPTSQVKGTRGSVPADLIWDPALPSPKPQKQKAL